MRKPGRGSKPNTGISSTLWYPDWTVLCTASSPITPPETAAATATATVTILHLRILSRLSALNPRFTFDSFVVGASNQFAHAAARSVATNPSRSYNPLFIYGGVGMGKTHLMHAIGRALIGSNKMRVVYTSSERFMNEVISGIRFDHMPALRQRYRSADVLLIDDIQLLGNKERTQEEFFHTFNELHDHQKQIVISSDAPPKEIPGLWSGCGRASSGA